MVKEMGKEEREHELNVLRLLMVPKAPPSVPLPSCSPFSLPVSGFLSPSSESSQSVSDCGTVNYSTNSSDDMATYFKL
jgi:hypothetical protein